MGLDLVGGVQTAVHDLYDGTRPRGWDHQMSAGGEPAASYAISRQKLLLKGADFETTAMA